jgi:hypothetical protein
MTYNYLENTYANIPELRNSHLYIDENFNDFDSLTNYKFISIRNWTKNYPIPILSNNLLVLEINCNYDFPLTNLPVSLEVLVIDNSLKYPLVNLPNSLYQLEFLNCSQYNNCDISALPESIKILNLFGCVSNEFSQVSLPRGLKSLIFHNRTFKGVIHLDLELEQLDISAYNYSSNILDKFNLLELPITLKILYLPNFTEFEIQDIMLSRLINLETLYLPNNFNQPIHIYPPKLKKLILGYSYNQVLINLPDTLSYLEIGYGYLQSLKHITSSNLEEICIEDNKIISLSQYLPAKLKKLSIIETHFEFRKLIEKYQNIEIVKLPDFDYQESVINYFTSYDYNPIGS